MSHTITVAISILGMLFMGCGSTRGDNNTDNVVDSTSIVPRSTSQSSTSPSLNEHGLSIESPDFGNYFAFDTCTESGWAIYKGLIALEPHSLPYLVRWEAGGSGAGYSQLTFYRGDRVVFKCPSSSYSCGIFMLDVDSDGDLEFVVHKEYSYKGLYVPQIYDERNGKIKDCTSEYKDYLSSKNICWNCSDGSIEEALFSLQRGELTDTILLDALASTDSSRYWNQPIKESALAYLNDYPELTKRNISDSVIKWLRQAAP